MPEKQEHRRPPPGGTAEERGSRKADWLVYERMPRPAARSQPAEHLRRKRADRGIRLSQNQQINARRVSRPSMKAPPRPSPHRHFWRFAVVPTGRGSRDGVSEKLASLRAEEPRPSDRIGRREPTTSKAVSLSRPGLPVAAQRPQSESAAQQMVQRLPHPYDSADRLPMPQSFAPSASPSRGNFPAPQT